MAVDPWGVLAAGGKPALDLLEYSVISVQLELVAGWLIADYRNRPTAERALALYDAFLAPGVPARIRAESALPPRDLLLPAQIERIRRQLAEGSEHNARHPDSPRPPVIPPRTLFDALYAVLTAADFSPVRSIREAYDPGRGPVENLPGGRMTAGQRQFIEYTWRAQVRPRLLHAGFHRVATIGG